MNAAERFWAKVDKAGPNGCWAWTASTDSGGYGRILVDGRLVIAHRFAYELLVGPIPDGMVLDHLCHNRDSGCCGGRSCPHRRCVNPAHLEPVMGRTNTLRGNTIPARYAERTHCGAGHPFDAANTYLAPRSGRTIRVCRACRRLRERARGERQRQRRAS